MNLPEESARLAAWAGACLAGLVAPDDLAEHAVRPGQVHRVAGLGALAASATEPTAGPAPEDAISLPLAVAELRRRGARRAWLAWPVPGDPAGLPGPSEANRLALEAGQAVVVEPAGPSGALALVPSRVGSSGVLWTVLRLSGARTPGAPLAEADRALKAMIREATEELDVLDVARARTADLDRLEAIRRRPPSVELPRGFEPRAHSLLDTAQRLAGLLDVALQDDGAAVSRVEADRRAAVLRDLGRAVRTGYTAAVNALAESDARAR